MQCPCLSALFQVLKRWLHGQDFSFNFFFFSFFGPKYCAKRKVVNTLVNFLFGSSKLAIWLTCRNWAQSAGSVQPVPVLEGLLKTPLRVGHTYYQMMDNIPAFSQSHMDSWGFMLCGDGRGVYFKLLNLIFCIYP